MFIVSVVFEFTVMCILFMYALCVEKRLSLFTGLRICAKVCVTVADLNNIAVLLFCEFL